MAGLENLCVAGQRSIAKIVLMPFPPNIGGHLRRRSERRERSVDAERLRGVLPGAGAIEPSSGVSVGVSVGFPFSNASEQRQGHAVEDQGVRSGRPTVLRV